MEEFTFKKENLHVQEILYTVTEIYSELKENFSNTKTLYAKKIFCLQKK